MIELTLGFPGSIVLKNMPANAEDSGDTGSNTGLGRSLGGGNFNPLLKTSTDRGAYSPWGCKESDTHDWATEHTDLYTELTSVDVSLL